MELSIPRLAAKIPTEADAYKFLEEMRWHSRPVCPHCGSLGDHHYLAPSNGVSRKTNRGTESQRRVWKCRDCARQFSATTGTVLHGSHVPLRTWLLVMFEMVSSENGVSFREIERKYDLHPKTAWYLSHRIREAMAGNVTGFPFAGTVQADEAYIGGTPRYMHRCKTAVDEFGWRKGRSDKTPVVTLIHTETGEARSEVVNRVNAETIEAMFDVHTDRANVVLHTDRSNLYRRLDGSVAEHESVDHGSGEYVRGAVSTNAVEGYFSQLKRSIHGTYHYVSRKHLHRYVGEFDFRYSTHDETDTERMGRLIGRMQGRELSYAKLRS